MPMSAAEVREEIMKREIYDLLHPLDSDMREIVEALLKKAKEFIAIAMRYGNTETNVDTLGSENDLGQSEIVIKVLEILGYKVVEMASYHGSVHLARVSWSAS